MKIYMVTVDDETAHIINRAEANGDEVFIGDFVDKRPTIRIELYVNISGDISE
jgi:hypothetical protein